MSSPGVPCLPTAMRKMAGCWESVKYAAFFVTTASLMNVAGVGLSWYSRISAPDLTS